jgi:hypothetical protein
MRIIFKSALPMCPKCRAEGALPRARTKRRNGSSNESRAQRARLVAYVPPEASHEEVHAPLNLHGAVASVTPGIYVPTVACPRGARRGRNRNNPNAPPATRSAQGSFAPRVIDEMLYD